MRCICSARLVRFPYNKHYISGGFVFDTRAHDIWIISLFLFAFEKSIKKTNTKFNVLILLSKMHNVYWFANLRCPTGTVTSKNKISLNNNFVSLALLHSMRDHFLSRSPGLRQLFQPVHQQRHFFLCRACPPPTHKTKQMCLQQYHRLYSLWISERQHH